MAYEFKLPDIGEGVVEGEIVRWLVKEGDYVKEDQPMVEIMTDKATVEIPAPRAGRVARRMYAEGQMCPVGKVLISIDEEGGSAEGNAEAVKRAEEERKKSADRLGKSPVNKGVLTEEDLTPPAPAPSRGNGAVGAGGPALATPATRKLARDLGVDLRALQGSGRAGRITSDDVRGAVGRAPAAATARPASPPVAVATAQGDVRIPFRGLRKRIADNMVRSKHTAAHFTYVEEVDVTDLVFLRDKANERLADRGVKVSYLPFIIKAVVAGLQKFPQMNAALDETTNEIVQRRRYSIGIAAATKDGLMVPVVHGADRLSIVGLAQEIERLSQATKAGKATREELTGSTFTITSLGQLSGVLATPIINFPEVAILGVHKIARRPAVRDDKIVARDLMNLSISVDHRLVDGYDAAVFMAEVKQSLETPGLLFLESI